MPVPRHPEVRRRSRSHRPRSTAPPPVTASHKSHNAPYRPPFGDSDRVSAAAEEIRRGAIIKTGNATSAAHPRRGRLGLSPPALPGGELRRRQKDASEKVKEISSKAQHRLHFRYARLMARGKTKQQAMTAVARELAGFVWAVGVAVERQLARSAAAV